MFKTVSISLIVGIAIGMIAILLLFRSCNKPVVTTAKDNRLDSVIRNSDSIVILKNKSIDSTTKAAIFWQAQYNDVWQRLTRSQIIVKSKIDSIVGLKKVYLKYKLLSDTLSELVTCAQIAQMLDDLTLIYNDAVQKSDSAKRMTDSLLNSKDSLIVQQHSQNLTLMTQVQALRDLVSDIKNQLAATNRKLSLKNIEGWIEKALIAAAVIFSAVKK